MKYIPLPPELHSEIQKIIESRKELGYLSVPDFVRDAVREKLLSLKGLGKSNSFIDTDSDAEVFE